MTTLKKSFEILSHTDRDIRRTWPDKDRANGDGLRDAVEMFYMYNGSGLTCAENLKPLITRFVDSFVADTRNMPNTGTWTYVVNVNAVQTK